jgi:hypothetical protein
LSLEGRDGCWSAGWVGSAAVSVLRGRCTARLPRLLLSLFGVRETPFLACVRACRAAFGSGSAPHGRAGKERRGTLVWFGLWVGRRSVGVVGWVSLRFSRRSRTVPKNTTQDTRGECEGGANRGRAEISPLLRCDGMTWHGGEGVEFLETGDETGDLRLGN